jgi:O-antigen/teichoic acid export membrane protein
VNSAGRPPDTDARSRTSRTVARHGALGLAGAITSGAGGFALTVTVGRTLDQHATGVFFTCVAIFTILTAVLLLGADTGLVRELSSLRATGRRDEVPVAFRIAARPVLAVSLVVAAVGLMVAGPVARAAVPAADASELALALRVLAPFLVLSTASALLLNGAARGLGSMRSFTLVQQVLLPVGRPVAVLAAVLLLGPSPVRALAAWALPLVLAVGIAAVDVRRRMRAADAPATDVDPREVSRRFWRLTAPRGLAATFEVVIVWADVVLVTVLRGPAEAGIYAAASRFVTSGTLAMQAIRLAIGPVLAGSFGRGDLAEAERVHRYSTVGAILSTWPVYLTVALFAPGVLSLLGPGFGAAAPALSVLAVAMLAVVATGNANTVLNMAGRSSWAARNTGRAAAVMLALDLVLVPRFGIVGAALGWSAGMITDAWLGISQIRRRLGVRSFGPVVVEAAVRSGALNTANWASLLQRTVMGVPGPVTSAPSEGVHELIRTRDAALVTRGSDVLELVSASGCFLQPTRRGEERPYDRLGEAEQRVLDAVPVAHAATTTSVARTAGMAVARVAEVLETLRSDGFVDADEEGWRLRSRTG